MIDQTVLFEVLRLTVRPISGNKKGRFHDLLNVETAFPFCHEAIYRIEMQNILDNSEDAIYNLHC